MKKGKRLLRQLKNCNWSLTVFCSLSKWLWKHWENILSSLLIFFIMNIISPSLVSRIINSMDCIRPVRPEFAHSWINITWWPKRAEQTNLACISEASCRCWCRFLQQVEKHKRRLKTAFCHYSGLYWQYTATAPAKTDLKKSPYSPMTLCVCPSSGSASF